MQDILIVYHAMKSLYTIGILSEKMFLYEVQKQVVQWIETRLRTFLVFTFAHIYHIYIICAQKVYTTFSGVVLEINVWAPF